MNLGGSIKINKCGVFLLCLLVIFIFYFITADKTDPSHYGFMKNQNQINLRKLLIGSIQAAEKGGLEVVAISKLIDQHVQSKGKTKEGANDPVTIADKKSHCIMKQGLNRIFPKVKIVSEEDRAECVDTKFFDLDPTVLHENLQVPDQNVNDVNDVTFWIDPLDATQEYTEKMFQYVTTMVCVAVKGKPVIGVIHNPFTQKTVWAWQGQAMSEDLAKIKKDEDNIKNPVITVSRSHPGAAGELAKILFGEGSKTITAAGAGYKVLQVVFNNATAYMHTTNIKKWDICAGNAILNALNGRMTDLKNNEISYFAPEKDTDVINDKGLLATMTNHNIYLKQLNEIDNRKKKDNKQSNT